MAILLSLTLWGIIEIYHNKQIFYRKKVEDKFHPWDKFYDIVLLVWVFKASALWADAFYKLKCPPVRLSVCPCVCLFTFEVPFNGLFAPTSRSRMSEIRNPWGKVMEEVVSDMNIFVWKLSKIAAQKSFFFSHFFHFWGTV